MMGEGDYSEVLQIFQDRFDSIQCRLDRFRADTPSGLSNAQIRARCEGLLEGRLTEISFCLATIKDLLVEEALPVERPVDKSACRGDWGKQMREDWPNSTFGEAEPGIDRFDRDRS